MTRILIAMGTRPEAIKLAPLAQELRAHPESFQVLVCRTGQHTELLEPILEYFGIRPDYRLDAMCHGQSLSQLSARMLSALPAVFDAAQPDWAVVQGDTTSTLCAAQVAFYSGVLVVHVEAGLRTHNPRAPFPEEMNRVLVSRIASLHCAPTQVAADNLLREGVPPERVSVTGNTGIDALQWVLRALDRGEAQPAITFARQAPKRIVATMHRREAFGVGLAGVCEAINRLVAEDQVQLIAPLHPNPDARSQVTALLKPHPNLHLVEPLDYVSFVALMRSADVLLSDSGGIQEEAPFLGVPVVVLRTCTERPEGVAAGFARVTGYEPDAIIETCRELLNRGSVEDSMEYCHTIYGDGSASRRIRNLIHSFQTK